MILRQHPGASGKGGVVTISSHQAEGLQDAADLTFPSGDDRLAGFGADVILDS